MKFPHILISTLSLFVALSAGCVYADDHKHETHDDKAKTEAHEGRAGGSHHRLELLLRRRAKVLQECSGDCYRDPEFHGGLR